MTGPPSQKSPLPVGQLASCPPNEAGEAEGEVVLLEAVSPEALGKTGQGPTGLEAGEIKQPEPYLQPSCEL
jgi:hypothetical protein